MAIVSKVVLKSYFEDGKEPHEGKYIDLIDSLMLEGSGGDHGVLTGLADDDHPQYLLADGSRDLDGDLTITDDLLVQDDVVVKGGLITGITTPPFTVPNGTLFLHDDGVNDYGFQSAEGPLFLTSNAFYTGAEWRTIKAGTSATLYVNYTAGLVFRADITSRSAGGVAAYANRFGVDLYGNSYIAGGLYVGSSTAVTTAGRLKIAETLFTGGGIVLGYVSGASDADGIRMFNGTTLRGDIETQNSTWLRFNTHAVSNIYTPRFLAAAGGLQAGGSTDPGDGYVGYTVGLRPNKNSTQYICYGYYGSSSWWTSTAWDGDAKGATAGTKIDLSAVFGLPANVKAVNVQVIAKANNAGPTDSFFVGVGPGTAYDTQVAVYTWGNVFMRASGICTCDANGDIYYTVVKGATTYVHLRIMGYFI